ncbi:hypothetical protein HDU76_006111 [Blyttiomyces sp. JEL0837]|nr:hypothetical protein HDU76_006111 [Blyttiomyces sp. JEL0837]
MATRIGTIFTPAPRTQSTDRKASFGFTSKHVRWVCQKRSRASMPVQPNGPTSSSVDKLTSQPQHSTNSSIPHRQSTQQTHKSITSDHGTISNRRPSAIAESSMASLGSTNAEVSGGGVFRLPEFFLNYGACAVVHVPGYTALCSQLAERGDVSASVISRSLEGHFSNIINIAEEYNGDVVEIVGDSITIVWRILKNPDRLEGDSDQYCLLPTAYSQKGHRSATTDATLIAIQCCISISRLLNESEVWALEGMSKSFTGLKMPVRCAISTGTILDTHVGVDGIRLEHLVLGNAARLARDLLEFAGILAGGIAITKSSRDLVKDRLESIGITMASQKHETCFDEYFLINLIQQHRGSKGDVVLKRLTMIQQAMKSIPPWDLDDNNTMDDHYLLTAYRMNRRYLSEGALSFLNLVTHHGHGGHHTSGQAHGHSGSVHGKIPSTHLHAQTPIRSAQYQSATILSLSLLPDNWDDGNDDCLIFAARIQLALSIVVKCCKLREIDVFHVQKVANFAVIICAVGLEPWKHENHASLAIQTSFEIRELLLANAQNVGKFKISLSSGSLFQGVIKNAYRSEYRLVGGCLETGVMLCCTNGNQGVSTVMIDQTTLNPLVLTHVAGLFSRDPIVIYIKRLGLRASESHKSLSQDKEKETKKELQQQIVDHDTNQPHYGQSTLRRIQWKASPVEEVSVHVSPRWSHMSTLNLRQEREPSWLQLPQSNTNDVPAGGNATTYTSNPQRQGEDASSELPQPSKPSLLRHQYVKDFIHEMCNVVFTEDRAPIALFMGEAGMGKSVVLRHAKEIIESENITLCCAKAPDLDSYSLLHPYNIIMPQIFLLLYNLISSRSEALSEKTASKNSFRADVISDLVKPKRFGDNRESTSNIFNFKGGQMFSKRAYLGSAVIAKGKSMEGIQSGQRESVTTAGRHTAQVTITSTQSKHTSPTIVNDIQPDRWLQLIRCCLVNAGEDVDLVLPLLEAVVPVHIPGNIHTDNLGPDGRSHLLHALIVRLINFYSGFEPLCILIDDMHLMVRGSNYLIPQPVIPNAQCFLVLGSRPVTDYRRSFVHDIKRINRTKVLPLVGFEMFDTATVIIERFGERAYSIDQSVLAAIQSLTSGCPLFVDALATLLLNLPSLAISDGVLVPFKDIYDFQDSLPRNVEEVISRQFRQIKNREFIRFVMCASTVGSRFSLDEVANIWKDLPDHHDFTNTTTHATKLSLALMKHYSLLLNIYDEFGYFERAFDALDGGDYLAPFGSVFNFKTLNVWQVLRDLTAVGVSIEMKRKRHARLIALYDSAIEDQTETTFIPYLCRHHALAGLSDRSSVNKRVQYLEMMGSYMIQILQSYVEARSIYQQIKLVVLQFSLEDHYGNILLAGWNISLAHAFSYGLSRDVESSTALEYARKALDLLGFQWPETASQWERFTSKEYLHICANTLFYNAIYKPLKSLRRFSSKLGQHHQETHIEHEYFQDMDLLLAKSFTRGVMFPRMKGFLDKLRIRRYTTSWKIDGNKIPARRNEALVKVLGIVTNNLARNHAPSTQQIPFGLFALNVALRSGTNVTQAKGRAYANLAASFWFVPFRQRISRISLANAENQIEGLSADMTDPLIFVSMCHHLTACGDWSEYQTWLFSAGQKAFMLIYDGRLQQALDLEEICLEESLNNDFRPGAIWARSLIAQISILQNRVYVAESQETYLKDLYRVASTQQKIIIDGILCQLQHRRDEDSDSIESIKRIAEMLPSIDKTNYQSLHGVFLATLTAYSIASAQYGGLSYASAVKPLKHKTSRTRSKHSTNNKISPEPQSMPKVKKTMNLEDIISLSSYKEDHEDNDQEREGNDLGSQSTMSPDIGIIDITNTEDDNAANPFAYSTLLTAGPRRPTHFYAPNHFDTVGDGRQHSTISVADRPNLNARTTSLAGTKVVTPSLTRTSTRSKRQPSTNEYMSPPREISHKSPTRQTSQMTSGVFISSPHQMSQSDDTSRQASVLPVITQPNPDIIKQLRDVLEHLLANAQAFSRHFAMVPIIVLLKALLKVLESLPREAAIMLREECRVIEKLHPESVGLIVGVMAIKAWECGGGGELWQAEYRKANIVFRLAGINDSPVLCPWKPY